MRKFSKHWKSSKQKRKQRKFRFNAPLHIKRKFLSVKLSKELKIKYKKRNIVLKKGDKVKILRGGFRKQTGKVLKVNPKNSTVFVENMQNIRKDGTKNFYPIQASNLMLLELNMEDKERKKVLEKK